MICRRLARQEFERCKEGALQGVLRDVRLEQSRPYTQNKHYLESQRQTWLIRFRDACGDPAMWETELNEMASSRAYWKVAVTVRSDCSYTLEIQGTDYNLWIAIH